jgi:hypothetical protein
LTRHRPGNVALVALDRLPDAVEATLDTGDASIRNAKSVMAASDGSLERSRTLLAGADDAIERAARALDAPDPII